MITQTDLIAAQIKQESVAYQGEIPESLYDVELQTDAHKPILDEDNRSLSQG